MLCAAILPTAKVAPEPKIRVALQLQQQNLIIIQMSLLFLFLKNLFNLPNSKPRVGVNVPVPAAREAATKADPPDTTAKFTDITQ